MEMLSNKNQNTGKTRQLVILVSVAGGVLALLLLVVLVRSGNVDPFSLLSRILVGIFPQSIRTTFEDQARVMDLPLVDGSHAFWYVARAGGIVAYLLLWLATCWGIIMSSKVTKGYIRVPESFALHEYLPILGVVFAAIHALALLGDSYIGFDLWQLLVPFASSYEPFWTGLGSLTFYIFLALIASFYLRKQIGQKVWRAFHFTSYLAFLIALLHGMMAGSDSGTFGMQALYLVTGGFSLYLVYYRMLSYSPGNQRIHGRPLAEK